jgi:hypothetical protein
MKILLALVSERCSQVLEQVVVEFVGELEQVSELQPVQKLRQE